MKPSDRNSFASRICLGRFAAILLVLGTWTETACSSVAKHNVIVEAEARPKAEESISYKLISSNPELEVDSLRHQEAVKLVKAAFSARGMYEAPDPAKADMVVDIDYSVSARLVRKEPQLDPEIIRNIQKPKSHWEVIGQDPDGWPVYGLVTSLAVISGKVGEPQEVMVDVGYYEKRLLLTARENRVQANGQPGEELWSVELTTDGPSQDLRKILPLLAGTSIDFIGQETGGKVQVRVKENDGAIDFVKQGLRYAAH